METIWVGAMGWRLPFVIASIDELEKLPPPSQLSIALQEELNLAIQRYQVSPLSEEFAPAPSKDSDLKDLLNLLYFGALFDVKSQNNFTTTMLMRTHERGCCLTYDYVTNDAIDLLGEKDLDMISSLGNLLISRPVVRVFGNMETEQREREDRDYGV
ncbi:hypothetical protein CDL15_Pgr012828 [Punica granatum]|uniref:Uncharacterized protein n=1 Tax=Punica granatum TaxID=22663 RepID=A0A218XEG6_PUNGR|nr:hypothetical protein CDL15_Pgr012828 [Punica granatum]